MRETNFTTKEKQWLDLGKQVQSIIKTRKDWIAFKKYCGAYYPKCRICYDTGYSLMKKLVTKNRELVKNCPNCKPKK